MKTKTYYAETITPGYYFVNTPNSIRCYYLSGSKKGNKWIDIAGIDGDELSYVKNPEWWPLMWNHIPNKEELNKLEYFYYNPTNVNLS